AGAGDIRQRSDAALAGDRRRAAAGAARLIGFDAAECHWRYYMKLPAFGWLGLLAALAAIGAGVPPAAAAETITMVTTGKGSAQQWPIFIALTKGYMAENGVALDLVAAQSSAAAVQQLAAGSANLES